MRWNRLILVILLASICFGGTFTCEGHTDHDKTTVTTK
jgi:hypothetical protein